MMRFQTSAAARIHRRNMEGERGAAPTSATRSVSCFTPGTLIATPGGAVPVEDLRTGDKVVTRDDAIQEIRWTGRRPLSGLPLRIDPTVHPVRIRAGALGQGLPERDLVVSPNHRILVTGPGLAQEIAETEAFVSAKHLVGCKGIERVPTARVTYVHIMFDRHEVILSEGAWTESFRPGDRSLQGVGDEAREEILELFPELRGVGDGQTAARRTLTRREAKSLRS